MGRTQRNESATNDKEKKWPEYDAGNHCEIGQDQWPHYTEQENPENPASSIQVWIKQEKGWFEMHGELLTWGVGLEGIIECTKKIPIGSFKKNNYRERSFALIGGL